MRRKLRVESISTSNRYCFSDIARTSDSLLQSSQHRPPRNCRKYQEHSTVLLNPIPSTLRMSGIGILASAIIRSLLLGLDAHFGPDSIDLLQGEVSDTLSKPTLNNMCVFYVTGIPGSVDESVVNINAWVKCKTTIIARVMVERPSRQRSQSHRLPHRRPNP
ncbi:uncharacterized protein BDR25DRAFT_95700 [Lindgomyces ingoldianus]|uniref:Uncharacterized protein n=1 Tax=Lindgomyces ingoldianus TaxID=673940 RepID=A0ACB6QDY8_9PLEO|nr:uncharacterized protein BDR25DRAFT_95700 [Lindgomyces ingoldianus]KAF2464577.1 hypothetical protein BDR25DRAFT_95700 [Lindgomyces ingoldianus]